MYVNSLENQLPNGQKSVKQQKKYSGIKIQHLNWLCHVSQYHRTVGCNRKTIKGSNLLSLHRHDCFEKGDLPAVFSFFFFLIFHAI